MRRFLAFVVALLGVVAFLGACSGKSQQLQDKVASDLKSELKVTNVTVSCPKGVKGSKGETVTCTATGDFDSAVASKLQLSQSINVKTLKINVVFVDDNSFTANVDDSDLESQLSSQLIGSSGSDSASSSDTSSSVSTDTIPGE